MRHEAGDHAVEGRVVIEMVMAEKFDPLDMFGRQVRAQLDGDAAILGVQIDRVRRIKLRRGNGF